MGDATRREAGEVIFTAKLREFKTLGAVLGYRYVSDIIVPDGTDAPPRHSMLYRPSAHPGCVAPHLWLKDGSSLYDHFGKGYTLLATKNNEIDQIRRAEETATGLGVPMKVIQPQDLRLPYRYQATFALIRPDQRVAWRGNSIPRDFASIIAQVSGTLSQDRVIAGTTASSCPISGAAPD